MPDNIPILFINKEGSWFADGELMSKLESVKLFSEKISRNANNTYSVILENKNYPLQVEDVPFVIDELIVEKDKTKIRLTDSRIFEFSPDIIILKKNIAYISLFFNIDTRFSRKAQWQLNTLLVEEGGLLYLDLSSKKIPIHSEVSNDSR